MPFDLQLKWVRDIHQQPPHATSFTSSGIIVPERHSRLVRLDEATGQAIWEARIKNPWGWITVTDTNVVYLNQHRFLQCLDMETGKTLWEYRLADLYNGYLAAKGQYLITGGWRGYSKVACLNIASGKTIWVHPRQRSYATPIVSTWGVILPESAADELKSIQILSYGHGKIKFEVDIPKGVPVRDRSVGIQLVNNALYATTRHGEIHSFDLAQRRWKLRAYHLQGIRTIAPSYIDNNILFIDQDKHLCCYDLGDSGLNWRHALEHNQPEYIPATKYGKMLIIGTSEGQLIAFDDLGNRKLAQKVGKRILTNLFMTDGGNLILGTKGTILSFSLETTPNSDT